MTGSGGPRGGSGRRRSAMARRGDLHPGVPALLAVLGVLRVAEAAVVPPEVLVQLGHVTQHQAELVLVKTNSSASQVRSSRQGKSGRRRQRQRPTH